MPAYKTKIDALVFGLKLGFFAWLLALIGILGMRLLLPQDFRYREEDLFKGAWIYLGISVFVSGWSGFETHRLATGDRRFVIIPWWQWIIPMFCCMSLLPFWICLMLQINRREQLFLMKKPVGNIGFVTYLILGFSLILLTFLNARHGEDWIVMMGLVNMAFLFAADCVMVNQVTNWGNATSLAPRYAKFQFTLGHMLKAILLGGLYLTVLLKLFHVI